MLIYFEVHIISEVAAQIQTSFAFCQNLVHTDRLEAQECPSLLQFMFSLINLTSRQQNKYIYSVQIGQHPFELSFQPFINFSMHLNKDINTLSTRA